MLLQAILIQRIIIVLLVQIWPIFYGSYFAYKLLKRAKNRATYSLSAFFILLSLAYFFASFSVFTINTPVSYFIYINGIFCFVFGHCFFIIFSWVLVKLDEKSPRWKFHLIVIFYGIISTFVYWIGIVFNGIIYDSSTSWIPTYNLNFLIFSWIIFFFVLIIPQIYFSFKLLKIFEGAVLRRRINMFLISVFLELTVVFALFLYNTWIDNEIYRILYILTIPEISTIAAFLIYKSFGKELDWKNFCQFFINFYFWSIFKAIWVETFASSTETIPIETQQILCLEM